VLNIVKRFYPFPITRLEKIKKRGVTVLEDSE